jgi:hypothetical protein
MLSDWILFLLGVLHFWRQAAVEAFYKSWSFVGQTREGLVFAILVLLVFFVYLLGKHKWKGIWTKFWEKALEGVAIALIAFACVFLWKLFAEPWAEVDWASSLMQSAQAGERSATLRKNGDAAVLAQQKQQLENLKEPKAQKEARKCWASNHFGMANSTIEGAKSATAVIIHCNYTVDAPWQVRADFDIDIIPGALSLLDASVWMTGPTEDTPRPNIYVAGVSNPPLLANQHLVVTVYGRTDRNPRELHYQLKSLK